MSGTAADYMAEVLHAAGVKRIYGVVGDSLNGFTDSLRRLKSIDWIHMRHEEGAAFAAAAEAQLTGELAVCAGSCGPGNLHLINGLFRLRSAHMRAGRWRLQRKSPPAEIGIAVSSRRRIPSSLFQGVFELLCRTRQSSPEQMPRVLLRAIARAPVKAGALR